MFIIKYKEPILKLLSALFCCTINISQNKKCFWFAAYNAKNNAFWSIIVNKIF